LKAYVEEDQTGSRYTYAEKEGVEGGKERKNGGSTFNGKMKYWKLGLSAGNQAIILRIRELSAVWNGSSGEELSVYTTINKFNHQKFQQILSLIRTPDKSES